MNTERLVSIVRVLNSEIDATAGTIRELVGHLQQSINQPGESTQRQVETTLQQLRSRLREVESNNFSPGVMADLATLTIDGQSVAKLVGSGLIQNLEETFQQGFLSVGTLDQLKQIDADLKKLVNALQQAYQGLHTLGLKNEDLAPGSSVVGMGIPPDALEGLLAFEEEVHFFRFLLGDLTEITTGQRADSELYSLHSSIFGVDVMTALEVAAKFAAAIGGIKIILELMEKYRDFKGRAEELGEDDLATQLSQKSTERVDQRIESLTLELFQDCIVDDQGRVAELKNAVRLRLNGVVNRIEKGYTFDVRTALPETPNDVQKAAGAVIEQFRALRFEPTTTPLVMLPEPTADIEEVEAGTKAKKPKPTTKQKSKRDGSE